MRRPFRIDLTDYECLQKHIDQNPDKLRQFEDAILDMRSRGVRTVVTDEDGAEVYELESIN